MRLLNLSLLLTPPDLTLVPPEYHDLAQVFSKDQALSLPPHRPYDEYLVMPFGLTNAPAVFQALINDVLRDFLHCFVFVYLDDILIFSRDPVQHTEHVHLVLQWLLENRLFVKAEKCEFHVPSVQFLGFIIESGQVSQ